MIVVALLCAGMQCQTENVRKIVKRSKTTKQARRRCSFRYRCYKVIKATLHVCIYKRCRGDVHNDKLPRESIVKNRVVLRFSNFFVLVAATLSVASV